jgi:hypothetical protein
MICAHCEQDLPESLFPHERNSDKIQNTCRRCKHRMEDHRRKRMEFAYRFDMGVLNQKPRHAWGDQRRMNKRERREMELSEELMRIGWDEPMSAWLELADSVCGPMPGRYGV